MKNKTYELIVNEWQSKPINSVSDIDTVLDNFRVLFAYNSNKIENPETSYHDTREIFDNGKVVGYTGELRTLFEIQNQKLCYDFLREKIINKQPIDTSLILEIHLKFESIHPFADGNGRVGRTLMNYYTNQDAIGISLDETITYVKHN